jgi:diaminohydroxyphosphoribosylaminopyrimidine deaminase/5-amino-6-(5-phosphoribosylamino)uracil reductase
VDDAEALTQLAADGIQRVLVEGGGKLAASLIAGGLVDHLEWFRAPMVLGEEGRPSVAALALSRLADAPRFTRVALRELGPDVWESYERAS